MDVEEFDESPSLDRQGSSGDMHNVGCTSVVVVVFDTNLMRPIFVNASEPMMMRVGDSLSAREKEYIEKVEQDIVS